MTVGQIFEQYEGTVLETVRFSCRIFQIWLPAVACKLAIGVREPCWWIFIIATGVLSSADSSLPVPSETDDLPHHICLSAKRELLC